MFEGLVVAKPVMSVKKIKDNGLLDRIDFSLIVASNQFNPRTKYFINCFAYNHMAHALNTRIEKNCKLFIQAEFKPVVNRAKPTKGIVQTIEHFFEIKRFYVMAFATKDGEESTGLDEIIDELVDRNDSLV